MNRILLVPLVSLCVVGCSVERDDSAQATQVADEQVPPQTVVEEQAPMPSADDEPAPPPAGTLAMSGKQAYDTTCAACHETGVNGAPVTRNPADWENRSPLWQAVLMEHAKDGYFGMPPKGGNPDLTDMTVSAAAEYMLELTFPNLPRD